MTTLALTNFLAKYFFVEQILFMYPAFDQNSGPEISGHLAGSRNKQIYSSLDGR